MRPKTCSGLEAVQAQWIRWCEAQRTAASRVFKLAKLYQGMSDNPFASQPVLEWKRWHLQALKDGTPPEAPADKPGWEVLSRIRSAAAVDPVAVPVGLTLAEVEAVYADVTDRYAGRTVTGYTNRWAVFEDWWRSRDIPPEALVAQHVCVFLHDYSQGRRVATVRVMAQALAMVFRELGFRENPADSDEVKRYLAMLRCRRREAAAQKVAFREEHYQAIVATAGRVLPSERSAGA